MHLEFVKKKLRLPILNKIFCCSICYLSKSYVFTMNEVREFPYFIL